MHEIDYIPQLADLNLIPFEACELQVIEQNNVLDLEWYLQHVLAGEFLQAPDANSQIETGRDELVDAIWVPGQSLDRSVHAFEFGDKRGDRGPLVDLQLRLLRADDDVAVLGHVKYVSYEILLRSEQILKRKIVQASRQLIDGGVRQ